MKSVSNEILFKVKLLLKLERFNLFANATKMDLLFCVDIFHFYFHLLHFGIMDSGSVLGNRRLEVEIQFITFIYEFLLLGDV